MYKKLLSLSLLCVGIATLSGCWRKKECKPCSQPEQRYEEKSCGDEHSGSCHHDNDFENGEEIYTEETIVEIKETKRVSGPQGWPADSMK